MKTVHIEDGKWYRLGMHAKHECCGCGLVHSVSYKIEKGVVFERWTADARLTAKVRKDANIRVFYDGEES